VEVDVKRQIRSRSEWVKICAAWEASGLSKEEFADKQGLNPATLYWWRSHLRRGDGVDAESDGPGFVELVSAKAQPEVEAPVVVVRVGNVAIDFGQNLPPAWWIAQVAAQC